MVEAVVFNLADIDAVAFDSHNLDGAVGVDEFVDGVNFDELAVEEGFACGGEAGNGGAAGADGEGDGVNLVNGAVGLFVEREAFPSLGLHEYGQQHYADGQADAEDDGSASHAKVYEAFPDAEDEQSEAADACYAARKRDNLKREQDQSEDEDDDGKCWCHIE